MFLLTIKQGQQPKALSQAGFRVYVDENQIPPPSNETNKIIEQPNVRKPENNAITKLQPKNP